LGRVTGDGFFGSGYGFGFGFGFGFDSFCLVSFALDEAAGVWGCFLVEGWTCSSRALRKRRRVSSVSLCAVPRSEGSTAATVHNKNVTVGRADTGGTLAKLTKRARRAVGPVQKHRACGFGGAAHPDA
jgi:hypothetical protein